MNLDASLTLWIFPAVFVGLLLGFKLGIPAAIKLVELIEKVLRVKS